MRLIASVLLTLMLLASGLLLWRSPWGYASQDRVAIGAGASTEHLIGIDDLGRDRAVRSAAALLLGIAGSVAASALASMLAVALGSAAAFGPAWSARLLLYFGDLFLSLPWIFLLMMVRAALPLTLPPLQSAAITFLLLGFLGSPVFLRVHYARTASLRRAEWMLQTQACGLRPLQIFRHMLPHLGPLLWTQFVLYIPACIMAEANLGTLGLGISEPLSSWGSMLGSLQNSLFQNESRLIYVPIALLVIVLVLMEMLIFNTREANQ